MLTDVNKLTKEELIRFEDFINSPYFNRYDTVKRLFAYLKKEYPRIERSHVTAKKLSEAVYADQSVNNDKIRKLESDFNRLFEKFLLHEEADTGSAGNSIMFLKALRKKNLYRTYRKKLDEMSRLDKKEFGRDEQYYLNRLNFFHELFIYSFNKYSRQTVLYSIDQTDHLNYYFIYQSLVFNCNYYSDKYFRKSVRRVPLSMINDVYRFIENNMKHFERYHPDIITLYYFSYMNQTEDIKYLKALQKYFRNNKRRFDHNLTMMYYIVCESFLKIKVRSEPDKYKRESLFRLRNEIIRNRHLEMFFLEGRLIKPGIYFEIFNDAVNLKKFDWAEMFAGKFREFLPSEDRDDITNIVKLILDFFRKEYTDIFTMLNKVKKRNTRQFIYSRYIKMMMLYEGNDLDTLRYEAEAMRKYLQRLMKRKNDDRDLFVRPLLFLRYISFLLKLRDKNSSLKSKNSIKLISDMNKPSKIPEYAFWFEEKIKETGKLNVQNGK